MLPLVVVALTGVLLIGVALEVFDVLDQRDRRARDERERAQMLRALRRYEARS
jgi:hypothetical protein